jgi:hypothetical protein
MMVIVVVLLTLSAQHAPSGRAVQKSASESANPLHPQRAVGCQVVSIAATHD